MRLRHVKGAQEKMVESPFVLQDEADQQARKGQWRDLFGNDQPIYLEVGMGKGRFLMEHAQLHPERNYLGIEKYSSVLVRAVEKRQEYEGNNIFFLRMDAEDLTSVFAKNEIAGIYLNFSDPWPKDRHAKRRLPSKEFLRRFAQILTPDGTIEFKTDNRALFDFAVDEVEAGGFKILQITYDLHNDPVMNEENIMTEYEERFSAKGNPICKYILGR
jgi:tRNA (guanine-N7-)-methyltransferase